MATGKRYYWIKLKESFMSSDAVDFLMGQPNGANYVVLYQMLCLKTINTDGKLSRQIGEVIIPYDEQKIARDTKWFTVDTVRVALNLYKALGLIYEDADGQLVLTDHSNLVGSETDYAAQKRRQIAGKTAQAVLTAGVESDVEILHTDIEIRDRDKEIDTRDRDKNESTGADAPIAQSEPRPACRKYGEYGWVKLTDAQYTKLLDSMGQQELDRCIAYVDESAQGTHNKNGWRDWNLVLRKCHREGWGLNRRSGGTQGRVKTDADYAGEDFFDGLRE